MATIEATSDKRVVNNVMRHGYRVLSDEEKALMQKIKDDGLAFHELIAGLGGSRELSIAKTKVEEAVMWAIKHLTAETPTYTWLVYANSSDGRDDFTTGDHDGRAYQGVAINKSTPLESSDPADYVWKPYAGLGA